MPQQMYYFFTIFRNQNATTNADVKRMIEAETEICLKWGIPVKSTVVGCIQNNFWKFLYRGKNLKKVRIAMVRLYEPGLAASL